jgi:NTE family protein
LLPALLGAALAAAAGAAPAAGAAELATPGPVAAVTAAGATATTAPLAGNGRPPRIGLVLSGGGARGMAHVGVLKVLDELHVHVDAIAGTSMGAVVGGLYASGMSGLQIEKLMHSVDWQDAFRDRPPRADLGFRRKQEDRDYLVNLPLGFRGRKLLIPSGLVQGQKLVQILRRATLPVAGINDFDQLPTPFRAVATDLETGEAVVMRSGDLTSALRASMAAPGVLTPADREGRLLVDGGLVENLPIDVARTMGVDVLIVVDAGFPLQARGKLDSITSVSNQALAILVQRDALRQRALLGPRDVVIEPKLEGLPSYEFGAVERALRAGELAAHARQNSLAALADPQDADRRLAVAAALEARPLPVVSFISIDPDSTRYQQQINSLFADLVGKPLQARQLEQRVATLYGRGNFETLDYRLVPTPGQEGTQGLAFSARRKSWGPQYLRVGISLQDDFAGNSEFNAGARLAFTELGRLDAESVWDLQIGASPRIASEYYQPLSPLHRWFVAPHAQAEAHDVPLLQGDKTIATYRVRSFEYGFDLGRELGNWGEVRVGVLDSRGSSHVRLGDFSQPTTTYHDQAVFLRFGYDQLDSANFPRNGTAFTLNLRAENAARGAEGSDLLAMDWRSAWSAGKNTLVAWVSGGSAIGGSTQNPRTFYSLGGFLNLSGLPAQALAGPHYAIARGIYLRSVGTGGEGVLNVPAYAGVSVEVGNEWEFRNQIGFDSLRHDASLFFGADTYLGPAYLAAGFDDQGGTAFYLFLGRTF